MSFRTSQKTRCFITNISRFTAFKFSVATDSGMLKYTALARRRV